MAVGASQVVSQEVVQNLPANTRHRFNPWIRKIPWRRAWQATPIFWPGESHGQKSLAGYSPRDHRVRHDWSDLAPVHYGYSDFSSVQFSSVQLLSRVRLFVTPWIAACQAPLSITNSWSSLRFMSIESVMPSSHLILCIVTY